MTKDDLMKICKILDFTGKKEHIFFMTESQYKEEFGWFNDLESISFPSETENKDPKYLIAEFKFAIFNFLVIDITRISL